MLIRAIIFDLDGTLIDSREDLALAVNDMLLEHGFPDLSTEQIESFIGNGSGKLAKRALEAVGGLVNKSQAEFDALYDDFLRHYANNLTGKTTVYPGVYETLDQLASKYSMGVVTNKPVRFTGPVLKAYHLDTYFSFVAGGDAFEEQKPHPLPLQRAMEALHTSPSETLMVGDGDTDMEAGRTAGCTTVAAAYGYRSSTVLQHHNPDYTIDSFSDLLKVVNLFTSTETSEE